MGGVISDMQEELESTGEQENRREREKERCEMSGSIKEHLCFRTLVSRHQPTQQAYACLCVNKIIEKKVFLCCVICAQNAFTQSQHSMWMYTCYIVEFV